MTAKVAIGITTYLDLADPAFVEAIFDAYAAVSSKIVPDRIKVMSKKYAVNSRADFGAHWVTRIPYRVRANRSRSSALVERGELVVGAEWRRTGANSGQGQIYFRPDDDDSRDNKIFIRSKYSSNVRRDKLFELLVALCKPSYAMLHLFGVVGSAADKARDRVERFDGPIAGEEYFTSWKSSIGEWRKPDKWQLSERRQYKYLPELAWGNYLGFEFDGQFDRQFVEAAAYSSKPIGRGLLFQTTQALADIQKSPTDYCAGRDKLKAAFCPGFFRGPPATSITPPGQG